MPRVKERQTLINYYLACLRSHNNLEDDISDSISSVDDAESFSSLNDDNTSSISSATSLSTMSFDSSTTELSPLSYSATSTGSFISSTSASLSVERSISTTSTTSSSSSSISSGGDLINKIDNLQNNRYFRRPRNKVPK